MEQACRTLEISRSGYYDWLHHKPCIREQRNQALKRKLVELHQKYTALGLDSLYHLLKPDFGCSRKRVHCQMRLAGICSVRHQAYKVTTNSQHSHPVSSNLLKRNFSFERLNQAWVGDITYIPTGEGWLYPPCAAHAPVLFSVLGQKTELTSQNPVFSRPSEFSSILTQSSFVMTRLICLRSMDLNILCKSGRSILRPVKPSS